MLNPDFYYNYCPEYRWMIDLYEKIIRKVMKLQFKDELLYGIRHDDEFYFEQVDDEIREFKQYLDTHDINECISNINIFKPFLVYDYW